MTAKEIIKMYKIQQAAMENSRREAERRADYRDDKVRGAARISMAIVFGAFLCWLAGYILAWSARAQFGARILSYLDLN